MPRKILIATVLSTLRLVLSGCAADDAPTAGASGTLPNGARCEGAAQCTSLRCGFVDFAGEWERFCLAGADEPCDAAPCAPGLVCEAVLSVGLTCRSAECTKTSECRPPAVCADGACVEVTNHCPPPEPLCAPPTHP